MDGVAKCALNVTQLKDYDDERALRYLRVS